MAPGDLLRVRLTAVNDSSAVWSGRGATRVSFSYHWRRASGEGIVRDGLRTELPRNVAPGETVDLEMQFAAPEEPGDYLLELNPVHERIARFSERCPATVLRLPFGISGRQERHEADRLESRGK